MLSGAVLVCGEGRSAVICGCSQPLRSSFVPSSALHCSHARIPTQLQRCASVSAPLSDRWATSVVGPISRADGGLTASSSGRAPGRSLFTTTTTTTTQTVESTEGSMVDSRAASLSRVLYSTAQPSRLARTAAGSGSSGSPLSSVFPSVLVLAVTLGTAAAAAIRARVRAVRECNSCHGYGVQRCKLCTGKGTIEWEGKMAHREPCPMCLGRRMNKCTCCGGGPMITRSLFKHKHRNGADAVDVITNPTTALASALDRLRRLGRDEEAKLEQSDQFKEQIMMD